MAEVICCARGSDDPYTTFRLAVMNQPFVLRNAESCDAKTRHEFSAAPRGEREACLAWWLARLQKAIELDYWMLTEHAALNYQRLRACHEAASVNEDSDANKLRVPKELPAVLPAGTPMLFGRYHGKTLPFPATWCECTFQDRMSLYRTVKEFAYYMDGGEGNRETFAPSYVDWAKVEGAAS